MTRWKIRCVVDCGDPADVTLAGVRV